MHPNDRDCFVAPLLAMTWDCVALLWFWVIGERDDWTTRCLSHTDVCLGVSVPGGLLGLSFGDIQHGCMRPLQVTDFCVAGDSVRYAGFRGTIDSAGGLQMARGEQWIVGQFEGSTFSGQLTVPARGRNNAPGCSYVLSLNCVGPRSNLNNEPAA
jgi:hypothetical protein